MIRTIDLLEYRERTLIQRLHPSVLTAGLIKVGEITKTAGNVGMIRAEGFLQDPERALVQRLGFFVLRLRYVGRSESVEAECYTEMLRPKDFFRVAFSLNRLGSLYMAQAQ